MDSNLALLLAEMQGRARQAFHANRSLLCARTPLKQRLTLHTLLVRGAALRDAQHGQCNKRSSRRRTAASYCKPATAGARPPMEPARVLLHQHEEIRWSMHSLQMQWNLWGHIARAPTQPAFHILRWRDMCWWTDQQAIPPSRGVRHEGHHNHWHDPECYIGAVAQPQWWIQAQRPPLLTQVTD